MERTVVGQPVVMEAVTRRFGKFVALDGLSFEVGRGEIFGLLGPNGAGKTTAINLISGLLRRDGGEIRVLGFDPEKEPRQVRRRIGLVPQETNLYGDLSAQENLWHHAALYNANLGSVGERIDSLLRLLELWERRKSKVRTFSGGMKRRLALARALLHDPPVIFFDEPTLGVDVQGRHVLWEHIRAQQAQGKTFIVSTNDMAEAEALCDCLVIIDHGKAIALDSPENLKAALGRDIVSIRTTPAIDDPQALFDGLGVSAITRGHPDRLRFEVKNGEKLVGELVRRVGSAHRLESISVARPSLDDVFLHYTGRALRD
jgi:ABC-2 type transport system ATP-binding protein